MVNAKSLKSIKIKTEPISKLVDNLPTDSVTVYMLKGFDYIIPGEWENLTGFQNTIQTITGETDPARIKAIEQQVESLYADTTQGYQQAMWLYQKIDVADQILAATAIANKVSGKIGFLSFIEHLTPKPDVVQSIDLGLKLVVEMLAFSLINGLPKDKADAQQFAQSLLNYSQENIMRMVALICVDGIIPLGPDFISKTTAMFGRFKPTDLQGNAVYKQIKNLLPGSSTRQHLNLINQTLEATQNWLQKFQNSHNLTPSSVMANLKSVIDIADDKLDYVGAFLDATTNYYAHTGTQSIARQLILRASEEIPDALPQLEDPKSTNISQASLISNMAQNVPIVPQPPQPKQSTSRRNRKQSFVPSGNLQHDVKDCLDTLGITYRQNAKKQFYFQAGSTVVYVNIYTWKHIPDGTITVLAPVATKIKQLSKEAGLFLLQQNDTTPLGAFALNKNDNTIYLTHSLPGQSIDEDKLAIVIDHIAELADKLDEEVARMTGGSRVIDHVGGPEKDYQRLSEGQGHKSKEEIQQELERYLQDLNLKYQPFQNGFAVKVGSTTVHIDTYQDDLIPQILVDINANVASEIKNLYKEMVHYLVENNWRFPLGGFCFDAKEDTIYFSYKLLGDKLDTAHLKMAISHVGMTADKLDDNIAANTGGLRDSDR